MRPRSWAMLFALVLPLRPLAAPGPTTAPQQIRLAVTDFAVSSDDPKLRYVGKGLAEMVTAELARSRDLTVIDRAKRDELLGEMEFALSDVADESKAPQVGKLLAAQYLLYGDIIDMAGQVLLSCRLTEVETSVVVWTDSALGGLADYDALSSRVAASLLASRGLGPEVAPTAGASRTAAQIQRREEAIVAFSTAVDALDRDDVAEATRQVKVAAAADRNNPAVRALFDKLVVPSPRYQPEIELYTPIVSPANEAMAERGSVGAWVGAIPTTTATEWMGLRGGDGYLGARLTGSLPVGRRMAVAVEAFGDSRYSDVTASSGAPDVIAGLPGAMANFSVAIVGVRVGVGYRLVDALAVGLSGLVSETIPQDVGLDDGSTYVTYPSRYETQGQVGTEYGLTASLAYRNSSSTLFGALQVSWVSLPSLYLTFASGSESGDLQVGLMPIVVETSVTGRIPGSRLFGSLRVSLEQDLDARGVTLLRGQPLLEWWPADWFTFRLGFEYDLQARAGTAVSGLGVLGGATFVVGKLDISVNAMASERPVRALPDAMAWGGFSPLLLIGVSWHGLGERPP